jgi:hypothetical protein
VEPCFFGNDDFTPLDERQLLSRLAECRYRCQRLDTRHGGWNSSGRK